jgi:AcrR family transcriptional regulator
LKKSQTAKHAQDPEIGVRLSPQARKEQILKAAIDYFAEVGFSGQTRELSRRIGVSQALVYRYFPSKADLIDEVFEAVFMRKWNPQWIRDLRRRQTPIRERLIHFYTQYANATYRPEWIRIYMFAGLAGMGWNRNYLDFVRRKLLTVICEEIRYEFSRSKTMKGQAKMFYWAVRCNIFGIDSSVPFEIRAADAVDLFLAGAAKVYPQLVRKSSAAKPPR